MFALGCFPFILAFGAKWNLVGFVVGCSHEKLQVFHQWLSHLFRESHTLLSSFSYPSTGRGGRSRRRRALSTSPFGPRSASVFSLAIRSAEQSQLTTLTPRTCSHPLAPAHLPLRRPGHARNPAKHGRLEPKRLLAALLLVVRLAQGLLLVRHRRLDPPRRPVLGRARADPQPVVRDLQAPPHHLGHPLLGLLLCALQCSTHVLVRPDFLDVSASFSPASILLNPPLLGRPPCALSCFALSLTLSHST